MWMHGGGWALGDVDGDDFLCEYIATKTNFIVVSVEYHLAPEYLFPTAVYDCIVALQWIRKNIAQFGGNSRKIYVAGESAGGNLAAAVTSWVLSNQNPLSSRPPLAGLLLVYPTLEYKTYRESHKRLNNSFAAGLLSLQNMETFRELYLGPNHTRKIGDERDYLFTPPSTSPRILKCYPATRIVLAKSDILYDEGLSFANSLQHLGVQSKSYAYSSVHGFFGRIPGIGLDALQDACAALLDIEKDS
jgi:acetyl esterase